MNRIMGVWKLPSHRHPLWRGLGWTMILGTIALTTHYMLQGPRHLEGSSHPSLFSESMRGTLGTLMEQHGDSRLLLAYQSIQGAEDQLRLEGVAGRLEEPEGRWLMKTPLATRQKGAWILQGPLSLELHKKDGSLEGRGRVETSLPALRWDRGRWEGLSPLLWESLQGEGKGQWVLPAGWRREQDGRMVVEKGGVQWKAQEAGALKRLEAEKLWTRPGFREGRLENVQAHLAEGVIRASVAEMYPAEIRWPGPLRFDLRDGWKGEAAGGFAPRPETGKPFERLELRSLKARRNTQEGEERLSAEGARWTSAGFRLEGDVQWDQPLDKQRLVLRAPRVLMREAPGPDLPDNLSVGHAVAEGRAVLTWGLRTLSSPMILLQRGTRQWRLQNPVEGRNEEGTFSSGAGQGNPRRWSFEGPVVARPFGGGTLQGSTLLWENDTWILTGRPATWTRIRERLAGARILRKGDQLIFPEGISGTMAAREGDVTLRADRAESQAREVRLSGGVECRSQGWRMTARTVTVQLGSNREVQRMQAQGDVSLQGRLGEGRGESLEVELDGKILRWQGKVRGHGNRPAW